MSNKTKSMKAIKKPKLLKKRLISKFTFNFAGKYYLIFNMYFSFLKNPISCYRLFTLVLWLPPCVLDRVQNDVADDLCIWDPSLNKIMVIVIGVLGHHGSFLVLFGCYLRVLFVVRRQRKIAMAENKTNGATASMASRRQQMASDINTCQCSETDNIPSVSYVCDNDASNQLQVPIMNKDESIFDSSPGTSVEPKMGDRKTVKPKSRVTKANKDARVFITLTYIIVGYLVCWVPFHVVYDVTAIRPDLVSDLMYSVVFWLTYFNSTLNPFLYNFSSSEFRTAFQDVLRGRHR